MSIVVKKKVRFDYFQIWCRKLDKEGNFRYEEIFDLENILIKAQAIDIADRKYNFAGENAILQTIDKVHKINKNRSIWGLQFIRVRVNDLPGIVKPDGTFEYMDLPDDEYMGEEVTALYDSELSIIAIQRNRDSLSPSGIETYFKLVYPIEDIFLKPIITPDQYASLKNKKNFRALDISFANLRNSQLTTRKKSLLSLFKPIDDFDPINAEFRFTMGQFKKAVGLTEKSVIDALKELNGQKEVTKLEVTVIEDDGNSKVYNLIEDRVFSSITLPYSRAEGIVYSRLIDSILPVYFNKRPELQRMLKSGGH